jgi:hypothetical protein
MKRPCCSLTGRNAGASPKRRPALSKTAAHTAPPPWSRRRAGAPQPLLSADGPRIRVTFYRLLLHAGPSLTCLRWPPAFVPMAPGPPSPALTSVGRVRAVPDSLHRCPADPRSKSHDVRVVAPRPCSGPSRCSFPPSSCRGMLTSANGRDDPVLAAIRRHGNITGVTENGVAGARSWRWDRSRGER